ncbi:hypothetical protein BBO99_00001008 [Phytophthora kernoviae]|uniref:Uncharacterized protein n=2 Tax=Phytophthora kernoviae TaxID=325452 RepID=A0A3R7IR84_9STRA|nr:hypothetical protein G195_003603 [Phytophthora kernoviae 00238/432]KAG2508549.1 hypothetical protein JM16_008832 [Phytophthora kernoviae]KAG2531754.1 hypothetical protein JM18_000966 [Phytophthora kernoviae]RLN46481.1 hypothetical protein BBI17_000909 [Phytophthora kernoviae]RLN84882.1 hypothetical protein BBO99_00001008 [Phytophthora kernoviae]
MKASMSVNVGLPANLTGIQFAFTAGSLTIHCSNFTGDIVLTKPAATADLPLSSNQQSTLNQSVIWTPNSSTKKRTIDLSASDDDEDDVDVKRLRPNFLRDTEQALLQAQMEKESRHQQSKAKAKKAKTETMKPLDDASAVNEAVDTAAASGRITKKSLDKKSKKANSSAEETGDSFFSPEPKQPASRKKTSDSHKKRGRKRAEPLPTKSIKDMMSGPPKPKATAIAQWKVAETEGNVPPERWGHTATKISNDRMVVYGGTDDDERTLGDLHVAIHVLHKVEKNEGDAVWKWDEPTVVGLPPQARTGHSSTLLQNGKILIFGGWDPQRDDASSPTSVFDDAFLLDTQSWQWEPATFAETSSTEGALRGRVGHSAVLDDNGLVHLFGGQNGSENRLKDVGTIAVTMKPGESKEPEDEAQTITTVSVMANTLETESI